MSTMTLADRLAHIAAQGPVRSKTWECPDCGTFNAGSECIVCDRRKDGRTVLRSFPASAPRGSWPAEEYARDRRREGIPARVVMDLASDKFLVIVEAAS